ncbi:UNVERIFIED_CONTAM: hypothetical protein Sradi_6810100 [Sesamum radiatum]|uniref:Uncharacterized protein n=1 Tax=Sesamum radiatum TaxID=300843 RepID=A0AAW2JV69_SESRA
MESVLFFVLEISEVVVLYGNLRQHRHVERSGVVVGGAEALHSHGVESDLRASDFHNYEDKQQNDCSLKNDERCDVG